MILSPVKTRILFPPKDDLVGAIQEALPHLEEKTILAVSSKVVSIWQGRCVLQEEALDKDALIKEEAEWYLPRETLPKKWVMHTLKNNLLVPTAGIDESNGNGYYILWPKESKRAARMLYHKLKRLYGIKNFGIVIADSHTIPLRRGTIGISLGHYGFGALRDYRGTKDLFGRTFAVTQANTVDSIAAAAVLIMGEGNESTPLALIYDVPFIAFGTKAEKGKEHFGSFEVKPEEDLYAPLFLKAAWRKGGGGIRS